MRYPHAPVAELQTSEAFGAPTVECPKGINVHKLAATNLTAVAYIRNIVLNEYECEMKCEKVQGLLSSQGLLECIIYSMLYI